MDKLRQNPDAQRLTRHASHHLWGNILIRPDQFRQKDKKTNTTCVF